MTENSAEETAQPSAAFTEGEKQISFRSESAQSRTAAGGTVNRPAVVTTAGATGRRKSAIARVRIVPGTGSWKINGRSLDDYFPNKVHQQTVSEPFTAASVEDSYDVIARIQGGGPGGQAGALRLGVARALNDADAEASRAALKKAGMLTRDSRAKERKKAGLKKARKAPQYTKR